MFIGHLPAHHFRCRILHTIGWKYYFSEMVFMQRLKVEDRLWSVVSIAAVVKNSYSEKMEKLNLQC